MKNQTLTKAAVVGLLALSSQVAHGDADISVQDVGDPMQATANVDLCVTVPQLLIFGVGDVGANIAKLEWTVNNAAGAAGASVGTGDDQPYSGSVAPFTSPAPLSATATAAVSLDGGTGVVTGNQVELPVFLFSNAGANVLITSSVMGGATGGGNPNVLEDFGSGNTIPISSFTPSTTATNIPQPGLANNATSTATATAGVVNTADTWSYSYTPATIPAAGLYEARVTYVAATP